VVTEKPNNLSRSFNVLIIYLYKFIYSTSATTRPSLLVNKVVCYGSLQIMKCSLARDHKISLQNPERLLRKWRKNF